MGRPSQRVEVQKATSHHEQGTNGRHVESGVTQLTQRMEVLQAFWKQAHEASKQGLQGYLDSLVIDSRPPARLKKLLQQNAWEEELLKLLIPLFEAAAGFGDTERKVRPYITAPRGHCLAGESLIFDPVLGDYRRLDEIDCPFHVWARNESGEKVIAPALTPFLKGTEDLYEITLSNGLKFTSTLGHKVLSSSSWQQIRACTDTPLLSSWDSGSAKEHACDKDSSYVYITNIKYLRKDRYYDFTVPVHHNYEMAGVWHHNSKTSIIAMLCNWCLVYAKHSIRIVAAAADRDQAQILIDRCKAEAVGNPWLKESLHCKHYEVLGPQGILTALSADAPTSSGLLADLYIVDELSWHAKRDLFDILYSGKDKRPTGCFIIISNAGEKGTWQHELWESSKKNPRWLCHEVPPMSASWLDEALIEDQRATLPLTLFKRLHMNVWTAPGEDNAFVTREQLTPCLVGVESLGDREHSHVISIDYGMTKDRTALCVAHADDNGIVVLDTLSCWQGNQQSHVQIGRIEEWVREQMTNFRVSKIVLDAFQLEGLAQKFEPYVTVERVNFGGNMFTKLSENLRSLILSQRIKLYPGAGSLPVKNKMEDLADELLDLQIVQKSTGWSWGHSLHRARR